ncbi:MAG: hypothetical protein J6T39_03165, partial [Clostridia bacterium]|nr:hypothetical protein [Clostridia bacterium]
MKSLRKNFVVIMFVCLSILIGSFAGVLLTKRTKIYAADDVDLTVAKVRLYKDNVGKYYALHYNYFATGDTTDNSAVKNYYRYDASLDEYILVSVDVEDNPSALGYFEREHYKGAVEGKSGEFALDANGHELTSGKYVDIIYAEEVDFNTNTKSPFLKSYHKTISGESEDTNHTVEKSNAYDGSWIQSINGTDNAFMLKNANLEESKKLNIVSTATDTDSHNTMKMVENPSSSFKFGQLKEYLLVQFDTNSTSSTLLSLAINAKLDEYNISPRDKISTESVVTYSQLFDLTTTAELDTTASNGIGELFSEYDAQGLYNFKFTYSIRNNGIVTTNNQVETDFYLLSENFYINPARAGGATGERDNNALFNSNIGSNDQYTEPRVFNTERIDKSYYSANQYPVEKDFFNYTNQYTTNYDGNPNYTNWSNASQNYLQYPTIKYDAARYNLSYTKTMSGITTTVKTALTLTNAETNEYKLVLSYSNPTKSWTETLDVVKAVENSSLHDQYIATVILDNIGTYVIDFDYVINGTILNSESEMLFIKAENWDMVHTNELTIFGYQLMHSEYYNESGATEKEMKYIPSNLYSDVTNANISASNPTKIANKTINEISAEGEGRGEQPKADGTHNFAYNTYSQIPLTNQAPLFFRYYSSLVSVDGALGKNSFYYFYKKNNNTYTLNGGQRALTSNTRFTDSGLYFVFITYSFPGYEYLTYDGTKYVLGDESAKANKVQIFAFEVENIEPNISFYSIDGETKTNLATGSFTNKSVEINWQEALQSPFDVKPKITVSAQAFGSDLITDITKRFSNEDIASGKIVVSESDHYYVKVEYGPCTYNQNTSKYEYSASITYSFTVDKEPIDSLKFYTLTGQAPAELNTNITSKNFALVFGKIETDEYSQTTGNKLKNSNAKISVSYSYLPINSSQLIGTEPINELSDNYVYHSNGTLINKVNKNIIYNSDTINSSLSTTSKNVLSSDGIYIFTFVDEAGNTAIRFVTKDTSKPVLLQNIDGVYSVIPSSASNEENMVNLDTTIVWGTHKAIKIDDTIANETLTDDSEETILELLNNEYKRANLATIYNGESNNYLCIALNSTINSSPRYEDIPTNGITVYYINENGHYMTPSSQVERTTKTYKIMAVLENEHLFKVRIYDALGNRFEGKVEMSFDKSALQATVSGLPAQNKQIISSSSNFASMGDGSSERLEPNSVSNKKTISFSWIAGEGDFTVKSVVCEFYPLTYEANIGDQINPNYPYASNYSNSFDLMKNTSTEVVSSNQNGVSVMTTRTKTAGINLVQDSRYGDSASVQGMYKIIRTYQNSVEPPKEYYFYLDRNNLISTEPINETDYVGDAIKVVLAENSNLYEFAGQDFLQEFIFNYIFKTNKQPANISIPRYKYYFNSISTDLIDNSKIAITRLSFDLFAVYESAVQKIDGAGTSNNMLSYNMKNTGSGNDIAQYLVLVKDNSYTSDNEDYQYYNSLQFGVAVELYVPEATFIDNETSVGLTNSSDNHYSKNDTNVSLIWTAVEDNDINAKIDENNIKITQVLENGRRTVLYQIENGTVKVNSVGVNQSAFIVQNGNDRVLNLNNFASKINGNNCRIEVELKYKTDKPTFYGSYLSTTKIVYFDYEKPKINYQNLFNDDKYLSASNISLNTFE